MHINTNLTSPQSETLLPVPDAICHDPNIKQPIPTQTPIKPRHLYFAYGSNLSPTQMRMRCTVNPKNSSKPLAIAILHKWRWLICEAGYANVLPPPGMRVGPQHSDLVRQVPISGTEDAVYGILYEMDSGDERILDGYEGIDHCAEEADGIGQVGVDVRPREQAEGAYNKWYVSAEVVQWIDDGEHPLKTASGGQVPVLVYVDEERLIVGPPKKSYTPRMNRAIREAAEVGVSKRWLDEVLRKFIPLE